MSDTIILIPIYRNFLGKSEAFSLETNLKNLEGFTKKFVAPMKLKCDVLFNLLLHKYGIDVVFFEDKFFKDIDGYNDLMLDVNFYKAFYKYRFMLVCQLDALVLSNSLQYWIDKNFDYIGAPWTVENRRGIFFDSMGNGGLSLRKIDKFIEVLQSKTYFFDKKKFFLMSTRVGIRNIRLIALLNTLKKTNLKINFLKFFLYLFDSNEDYFWAFIAQYFVEDFFLASPKDALRFAFEDAPQECYRENNYELPFGCHAWERYDKKFWLQVLGKGNEED